jgi:hypothetical protein
MDKRYVGEIIKEALEHVCLKKLNLVSDGGPENANHYIEHLLNSYREQFQMELEHLIALKTIQQSNSMIERFFRILKSGYLYHDIPLNHAELVKLLKEFIHMYNFVRPHHALNHLTPHEAFIGVAPPNVKELIKKEKLKRFKKNKNCACKVCDC